MYTQVSFYTNLYIKKQRVFYCTKAIYIAFILFQSNRVWFENYKSGISFVY